MFTVINTETKKYLRADWEEQRGQLYTHDVDLAVKFENWHDAEDITEATEQVVPLSNE
ncbi:hypothetical protein G7L40_20145 [Paenibacillus polymyxa]|uniref:Uncharacterized protein n=1 Tax=Paenibacillus polymyxa TaxID=1406 RepID=A0A378Y166_PAEPO|nr:hypothetical protein [Paenibacillus polymyxa]MBE7896199.1 hypothetical protein [Paenibacillus polymyxa]MCC3256729.1 hypothetical protein [Paenibacillus polymyxa]QPK54784.1 hypothetical protein G7035_20185 [Paenibacillus polymyxa]QPK59875.1 hypothetical protein G7L40_20145 [Paenibacillus polymyxa]SUA70291.1 Uncharacterised protein [Paenibacillus polymyxa]